VSTRAAPSDSNTVSGSAHYVGSTEARLPCTQRRGLAHMALPYGSHSRALWAHFAIRRALAVVPSPLCAAWLPCPALQGSHRAANL
jgi:hypothetical protein